MDLQGTRKLITETRKLILLQNLSVGASFRFYQRPSFHGAVTTATFAGDDIKLVLPEVVSQAIYCQGFFERGLSTMIVTYLKPGMVFFDIGAHYGYFSLLASRLVGKSGAVHAFEPTRPSFRMLRHNVREKTNISLSNIALWSKQGVVSFNDYGEAYSAFNSMYQARLPEETLAQLPVTTYSVPTISVDDYVNQTKAIPDFIKIDAESAEFEILKGMERTIAQHHPMITLEVGDEGVKGVVPCKDMILYLINKGYKAYEFKEGEITEHVLKEKYKYDNILFLPSQNESERRTA